MNHTYSGNQLKITKTEENVLFLSFVPSLRVMRGLDK